MTKPLIIFGAGSLARLALYYATRDMSVKVLGFAVDENRKTIDKFCNLPVISWEKCLSQYQPDEVCFYICLLYTSPSPRDATLSRMPSSA